MICTRCRSFCKEAATKIKLRHASDAEAPTYGAVRWGYHSAAHHSSLAGLKAASDARCPVCRTIYFAPPEREREELSEAESCIVVLELVPGNEGLDPVLTTTFLNVSGEVLVPKSIVATFNSWVNDDELLACTLRECAELPNTSTGSDANFRLASFWLNRCLETHPECAKFVSSPPFMPTRVLDVGEQNIRLVESKQSLETSRKYVALSHCWGKVPIINTKKNTLDDRRRRIGMDELSKTFQDAVEVTRRLSFRYLWIDSLCIIQDDYDDWKRESAQMCDIYQKAAFTIAAIHAENGSVGCFQERDGVLQLPYILDFPLPEDYQAASTLQAVFASYGRRQGFPTIPALRGRAWVLQEEMLSPRTLKFDGAQMQWECQLLCGSERLPKSGMGQIQLPGSFKDIQAGIRGDRDPFAAAIPRKGYQDRWMYSSWYSVVSDYTHRGMTKPFDRLVAISGVANALRSKTNNEYLAGLWKEPLYLGLLWCVSQEVGPGNPSFCFFDVKANSTIRHENQLAPTWSWASVTAPVTFMINHGLSETAPRICELNSVSVQGSLAEPTGAIQIRGHVRRAYVSSVYSYAIREAAEKHSDIQLGSGIPQRTGMLTHCGRSFSPKFWFLYSQTRPTFRSDWLPIPGYWRPDEVLDPQTQITFLAITQQPGTTRRGSNQVDMPLEVWTLGMVPTGKAPNEYRRVGVASWNHCAWYGYDCCVDTEWLSSWTPRRTWGRWFWEMIETIRGMPPAVVKVSDKSHEHHFEPNVLPDKRVYHEAVNVCEESLVIV